MEEDLKKIIILIIAVLLVAGCRNIDSLTNDKEENTIEKVVLGEVEEYHKSQEDSEVQKNTLTEDNIQNKKEISHGSDYDKSILKLIDRANDGDLDAMNTLAYYYFNGYNVEQDYQKSLDWSIKSAEGGNLASMFNVGYNYYYGYAGEKDYDLAFKWYERAANQMFPKALNALGHMYYEGLGVEKNVDNALEYTMQSAGFLHNYSFSNMGSIIDDEGLDSDSNYWYRLAAKNYVIQSASNKLLYDNLKNGSAHVIIDNSKNTEIPSDFIEGIIYMYYSGTLYEYLESENLRYRDFDVNNLSINDGNSSTSSRLWHYDNHYMIDLDDDGIDELISYQLDGSIGGSAFQILKNINGVYKLEEDKVIYSEYGINGFITYEGNNYFIVGIIDIGNRAIYNVNIFLLKGIQVDEIITIELKELDTNYIRTFQSNEEYEVLNNLVEKRIKEMFYKKYKWRMLYENVNESLVIDTDINNDGDLEHYEYESIFWGTINRPITLEFRGENKEEDLSLINKILLFNDLGIPIGIEIFTLEGINYIGVLSYELGTNNYCLSTFMLEDDEMTLILNHLITFNEKIIVK